jgi:hypothetical protein
MHIVLLFQNLPLLYALSEAPSMLEIVYNCCFHYGGARVYVELVCDEGRVDMLMLDARCLGCL